MTTFTLIILIIFVFLLVGLFIKCIERDCYCFASLFGFLIIAFIWIATHI